MSFASNLSASKPSRRPGPARATILGARHGTDWVRLRRTGTIAALRVFQVFPLNPFTAAVTPPAVDSPRAKPEWRRPPRLEPRRPHLRGRIAWLHAEPDAVEKMHTSAHLQGRPPNPGGLIVYKNRANYASGDLLACSNPFSGKTAEKTLPRPGWLRTATCPPCASTIWRVSASPRPVPWSAVRLFGSC